MTTLLIKNDGIGDLILSSGLIRHFAQTQKIEVLVCETSKGLEYLMPEVSEWHYVSRHSAEYDETNQTYFNISKKDLALCKHLSLKQFDKIICLRRFIRASTLFLLQNIASKEKIVCWEFSTNLRTETAKILCQGFKYIEGNKKKLHELDYYASCFFPSEKPIRFLPRPETIQADVVPKNKTVCVNLASKGWPGSVPWLEFISLLIADGYSVTIVGGSENSNLANFLCKKIPSLNNYVGRISLEDWAKFLSQFETYVGNDTGMSHMAMLVCDKVVVHHGGGGLGRFFPWPHSTKGRFIFFALECFDCAWDFCFKGHKICLTLVQPRQLFDAVINYEKYEQLINCGSDEARVVPAFPWRIQKTKGIKIRDFLDNKPDPVYKPVRKVSTIVPAYNMTLLKLKYVPKSAYEFLLNFPKFINNLIAKDGLRGSLKLLIALSLQTIFFKIQQKPIMTRIYRDFGYFRDQYVRRLFEFLNNEKMIDIIMSNESYAREFVSTIQKISNNQKLSEVTKPIDAAIFKSATDPKALLNLKNHPEFYNSSLDQRNALVSASILISQLPETIIQSWIYKIRNTKVKKNELIDNIHSSITSQIFQKKNLFSLEKKIPQLHQITNGSNWTSINKVLLEEIWLREDYYCDFDKDDPIIFDVGANLGISLLYFKYFWPKAKITAFEPNTSLFNGLKKLHLTMGWKQSVKLHNIALSSTTGEKQLYTTEIDSMASSLHVELAQRKTKNPNIEKVRSERLSTYLTSEIDLLKIDIEGAEFDVLEDSLPIISLTRNLICEFHCIQQSDDFERMFKIIQHFKRSGFEVKLSETVSNIAKNSFQPMKQDFKYQTFCLFAKQK